MDSFSSTQIRLLDNEPWVALADGRSLQNWSSEDEIVYNQHHRQAHKLAFFVQALDFIKANQIHGDYHEYGCHRGRTFRMALTETRRHCLHHMKFHAFDSFEGLPPPQAETGVVEWTEGGLCTSEDGFWNLIKEHGIYVDQCRTTKGFYQNSLTTELQQDYLAREAKIALATIDCDLYESAVPVFSFIEPLLQEGSQLYIDDYFAGYKGSPAQGVSRAFDEFRSRSRFEYEAHMQVGWWGRSFIAYLQK